MSSPVASVTPAPGFMEALRFWFRLGFISFGGPAGQIALMHEELVTRKRWLSEGRFLHALNYCMLLPGPEAQQLATYLGWLMHRTWGGVAAGALFVLPSLFILIGLSWVYVRYGQVGPVAAVFWGLKPAVTALVLQAAWRLGSRTLRHHALRALALGAFLALAVWDLHFPGVVVVAAVCGLAGARWWPGAFQPPGHGAVSNRPSDPENATLDKVRTAWLDDNSPPPAHARFSRQHLAGVLTVCIALWVVSLGALWAWGGFEGTYALMARFFTQAALVTFGGAYAVLPFVVQGAVDQHGWLNALQMMDGLALGETTPGPLIMVVAFVGFLGGWQKAVLGPDALFLAGALGACVATFFTFLPSFLFILAGGPLVEATRGRLGFTAPLTAISAAVVGVIASLALFFATHTFWPDGLQGRFDLPAALLAVAAAVALMRFKVGTVTMLLACGLCGALLRSLW